MSINVDTAGPPQWVSASEAARRLCCSDKRIRSLGRSGLISVLRLPGAAPRYRLQDAERLLASSIRPAAG